MIMEATKINTKDKTPKENKAITKDKNQEATSIKTLSGKYDEVVAMGFDIHE